MAMNTIRCVDCGKMGLDTDDLRLCPAHFKKSNGGETMHLSNIPFGGLLTKVLPNLYCGVCCLQKHLNCLAAGEKFTLFSDFIIEIGEFEKKRRIQKVVEKAIFDVEQSFSNARKQLVKSIQEISLGQNFSASKFSAEIKNITTGLAEYSTNAIATLKTVQKSGQSTKIVSSPSTKKKKVVEESHLETVKGLKEAPAIGWTPFTEIEHENAEKELTEEVDKESQFSWEFNDDNDDPVSLPFEFVSTENLISVYLKDDHVYSRECMNKIRKEMETRDLNKNEWFQAIVRPTIDALQLSNSSITRTRITNGTVTPFKRIF